MNECYLCGILEEKASLYEGICRDGFCFVCRKCYFKNKIPLVEKKNVDLKEISRRPSVRERLSVMAGLKEKNEEKTMMIEQDKFPEEELKQLVEANFKKEILSEKPDNMIEHFDWVIMRKRRALKLTRKEFADKIFEPLVVVESLEKGILPKDYVILIKKIENFLDVNLIKAGERRVVPEMLAHESKIPSKITISDLKKMHKEEVNAEKEGNVDKIFDDIIEEHRGEKVSGKERIGIKGKKDKDLSEEEIQKLIFGQK